MCPCEVKHLNAQTHVLEGECPLDIEILSQNQREKIIVRTLYLWKNLKNIPKYEQIVHERYEAIM